MDRIAAYDPGNPVSRYGELDRAVNKSGTALTVAIAVISLFFWSRDPMIVYASWIPLGMRALRAVLVHNEPSLYRWALCNAYASGLSIILGSSATGGIDSPIVIFIVVVGVMSSMMFAHQKLWNLYPLAIVAIVAAVDWLDGGLNEIDWLVPISTVLVSVAVPYLASDMVGIELSYRQKAVIDPLTGCLNRTSMTVRMSELMHQAVQMGDHIGVVAIDIDHFKSINDRYGHAVGDEVLQQVAYAIRRNLRRFELLYRTGGEEFVLLLPGATPDVAFRLGEEVRRAVAREQFQVGTVTVSAGTVSERMPKDMEALLQRADQSLLEAKQSGRNRTVRAGKA